MLKHYLKIAFRNLWKYKMQNIISIIGLAVGFTCFALATLWIRYEMTYDSFLKDAKQMYVVYKPDSFAPSGRSRSTNYPLAAHLKETFPEIADAIPLIPSYQGGKITVEGVDFPVSIIQADSSFLRMFDVKILEGSRDFLIPGSKNIAITKEKAKQLFGSEHPAGKTVKLWGDEYTICAVVSGISNHSNYAFDIISPFAAYVWSDQNWNSSSGENTIIKLAYGTNVKAFEKKLFEYEVNHVISIKNMTIKPLTKIRYLDPDIEGEVKFHHIMIFAVAGILVILCSMFNYFTLFVSRFRIRQKELALRMVCGASGGSLLAMLSVEFILTLALAVLLGSMLTQGLYKPFLELSNIQMSLPAIYRESLVYIVAVILVSLFVFWSILLIFRRKSLNLSIRRSNNNLSRKVSVIVQLVISIGFAFCTIVILKQMYFLHHTSELGFSFKNRGSLMTDGENSDVLANRLKQLPEITNAVDIEGMTNLLPMIFRTSMRVTSWDDKPADEEVISFEVMKVSPEYIAFYDFRLVTGEMLTDADPDSLVLLNESAVKAFGWREPVGKKFQNYTVKGVIKNVYNFAPTVQVNPAFYLKQPYRKETMKMSDGTIIRTGTAILFKYHEGTWESCKEKIEQMKNEYSITNIFSSEEVYNKFLKSENSLIKLLYVVSAICVLICIFGFVSLVSLTCEERQKEIAIRKINGATSGTILFMFAKEYFLLLMIGAAVAFSAGWFIMRRWLENYVKQTDIPAWIYLAITFAMALVIVIFVGWQVYKTSNENPAEVVKRE